MPVTPGAFTIPSGMQYPVVKRKVSELNVFSAIFHSSNKIDCMKSLRVFSVLIDKLFRFKKESLPDLLKESNKYVTEGSNIFFIISDNQDFDWLESKINANGYYERPGEWGFVIDTDKKIMAEIIAGFHPKKVLEIGCYNGCVMKCLFDAGISCDGIDISCYAKDRAYPEIKNNIHTTDIVNFNSKEKYDFIFALDLMEHINPNKIPGTLRKIHGLLTQHGLFYVNIPAYGKDPVFGTIFQFSTQDWISDYENESIFHKIPVDKKGYPIQGHLTWAGSNWWVKTFEDAGFTRMIDREKEIHVKYDDIYNTISVARMSFFIFGLKKIH